MKPVPALVVVLLLALGSCTTMGEATVLLGKEYYNLGNTYFELKRFDQAARAYQTALGYDGTLKIATLNLARTKAELGDTAAALDLLTPLAVADPKNLVVAQQMAWLLYKAGLHEKAAGKWLELADELPGDAPTQFNAGISLLAAERKSDALGPLDKWYALDGKNAAGVLLLADLVAETGDDEKAGKLYQAGLDLSEDRDATRKGLATGLARSLEAQKRYGDAVDAWKAALDLPSGEKDTLQGERWFRLARLQLIELEQYDEGLKSLLEAWKAKYDTPEVWKSLLAEPDLLYRSALETDLKVAGVTW
ncbi:MAG: tetratricopeptide repeat protein [Spirochaetales bacterium]